VRHAEAQQRRAHCSVCGGCGGCGGCGPVAREAERLDSQQQHADVAGLLAIAASIGTKSGSANAQAPLLDGLASIVA
jgi:hypothetical protein